MSKISFFLYGLFIVIVVGLANTMPGIFSFVQEIPYGDKIAHFGLLGLLAFLAARWGQLNSTRFTPCVVGVILIAVSIVEEFSQRFIGTRQFDYGDMLMNILGILTGASLAALLHLMVTTLFADLTNKNRSPTGRNAEPTPFPD